MISFCGHAHSHDQCSEQGDAQSREGPSTFRRGKSGHQSKEPHTEQQAIQVWRTQAAESTNASGQLAHLCVHHEGAVLHDGLPNRLHSNEQELKVAVGARLHLKTVSCRGHDELIHKTDILKV